MMSLRLCRNGPYLSLTASHFMLDRLDYMHARGANAADTVLNVVRECRAVLVYWLDGGRQVRLSIVAVVSSPLVSTSFPSKHTATGETTFDCCWMLCWTGINTRTVTHGVGDVYLKW